MGVWHDVAPGNRGLAERLALSYILPVRHDRAEPLGELADYLRLLTDAVDDVVMVDGSPPPVFAVHGEVCRGLRLTHLRPDARFSFANGKADGVHTGLGIARQEAVVIADEDVRWDVPGLRCVAELLAEHDVVRPQNYFRPLPWHARWDTARTLLNRAFGGDYPGTLGVRRSTLLALGGYDGNAMFENLELMRTVQVAGGSVHHEPGLYVRRLPPTSAQFLGPRVRQAFDDMAQPLRLVVELAVLPSVVLAVARRRARLVAAGVAGLMAVAEKGRRRAGGRAYFPPSCVLFVPAWLAERAVCVWVSLAQVLFLGGCRYRGRVMHLAATSTRQLQRRLAS